MNSKRGLSQVVTTIILILLILVAIGGIWAVVNAFLIRGTAGINPDQLTLDLKIKKAFINYTSGIASVQVIRNPGAGNLTAIKFIVEDTKGSFVFEEDASNLYELASRTYELDLNLADFLTLKDIYKISIAPVYEGSGGSGGIGRITDTVGGLNVGVNMTDIGTNESDDGDQPTCQQNSDCGTDAWVIGSEVCSQNGASIMQYKRIYSCILGFCDVNVEAQVKQECPVGTYCYDAACITEALTCSEATVQSDCGVSGWTGQAICSNDGSEVLRDWQEFSCVDSTCISTIESRRITVCESGEVCYNGECFTPLECTSNGDCDPGEVCRDGSCVLEEIIWSGNVRSVWPYGMNEYADSLDLPITNEYDFGGYYIIFPGSSQDKCLRIKSFQAPAFEGGISYLRFMEVPNNVSDGDGFEIWETDYVCSLQPGYDG